MTIYQTTAYEPNVFDPRKAEADALTLAQGRIKTRGMDTDIREKQRKLDSESMMRQKMTGVDPRTPEGKKKLSDAQMGMGNYQDILKQEKSDLDTTSKKLTNEQKVAELAARKMGAMYDVLSQAKDENQYQQGLGFLEKSKFDTSGLPKTLVEAKPIIGQMGAFAIGTKGMLLLDSMRAKNQSRENIDNAAKSVLMNVVGVKGYEKLKADAGGEVDHEKLLSGMFKGISSKQRDLDLQDRFNSRKDAKARQDKSLDLQQQRVDVSRTRANAPSRTKSQDDKYIDSALDQMSVTTDGQFGFEKKDPVRRNDLMMLKNFLISQGGNQMQAADLVNILQLVDSRVKSMPSTPGATSSPGDYVAKAKKIIMEILSGRGSQASPAPAQASPQSSGLNSGLTGNVSSKSPALPPASDIGKGLYTAADAVIAAKTGKPIAVVYQERMAKESTNRIPYPFPQTNY